MQPLSIGIIGDFNASNPTHAATNTALKHAAQALSVPIDIQWLSTPPYETAGYVRTLEAYDGLWGAPGSPYQSREGAINAIRFARERDRPFLGT
jgi:CTP synthase (UTP-ammonia lyase)